MKRAVLFFRWQMRNPGWFQVSHGRWESLAASTLGLLNPWGPKGWKGQIGGRDVAFHAKPCNGGSWSLTMFWINVNGSQKAHFPDYFGSQMAHPLNINGIFRMDSHQQIPSCRFPPVDFRGVVKKTETEPHDFVISHGPVRRRMPCNLKTRQGWQGKGLEGQSCAVAASHCHHLNICHPYCHHCMPCPHFLHIAKFHHPNVHVYTMATVMSIYECLIPHFLHQWYSCVLRRCRQYMSIPLFFSHGNCAHAILILIENRLQSKRKDIHDISQIMAI